MAPSYFKEKRQPLYFGKLSEIIHTAIKDILNRTEKA